MKKRSSIYSAIGKLLFAFGLFIIAFVIFATRDERSVIVELPSQVSQTASSTVITAVSTTPSVPPKKKVNLPKNVIIREGLVGSWDFDECSGINPVDTSDFKNKGFINGNTIWATSTKDGQGCALTLDADHEYMTTSPSDSISVQDNITISAWVKTDSFTGDQGIVDKTDNSMWNYSFYLHKDKLAFASTFATPATTTSSSSISGSGWHHVLVERQGHVVTFYIDGANAGQTLMAGKFGTDFVSLVFGTHRFKDQFMGSLDDIRIFNRALSLSEIQSLYSYRLTEE